MEKDISSRFGRWLQVATIAVLAAVAYWPALHSALVMDDYFLAAIARLVGNPLTLFAHSHMPGSLFYRPLGMLLWWLCVAMFGSAVLPQYTVNLVLHVGVAIALWRLLNAWTRSSAVATFGALAFALHPISIGTALWLSARFDLLAALLGLLAIDATFRFRVTGSRTALVAALACAALAPLAKEIGFSAYVAMVAIILWPAPAFASRPAMRRVAAGLVVIAAALLAWRRFVLGHTIDSNLVAENSFFDIVHEGFLRWIHGMVAFGVDLQRLAIPSRGVVLVGSVVFVAWMLARLAHLRDWRGNDLMLCGSAVGMMLATGVLQAFTLRLMPLQGIVADGQAMAMDSRMFYVSLIGLVMLGCGAASLALRTAAPQRPFHRAFALVAILACTLIWGIDARRLSRQYLQVSRHQFQLVRAALTATDGVSSLPRDCQVYFVDIPAELEPVFAITVDSAIKVFAEPLSRVAACRFQTAFTASFYILQRGVLTDKTLAPMEPVVQDGSVLPWLQFGGVEIAYLNLFPDIDATTLRSAWFFSFATSADGRIDFVDISDDVRAGRHPVKFRCVRSAQQCGRATSFPAIARRAAP